MNFRKIHKTPLGQPSFITYAEMRPTHSEARDQEIYWRNEKIKKLKIDLIEVYSKNQDAITTETLLLANIYINNIKNNERLPNTVSQKESSLLLHWDSLTIEIHSKQYTVILNQV
jgi:hypothetical protein